MLVIAQALGASGSIIMMVAGSIVGARLAPAPQWATVPVSAMIVGVALTTVPAALLMKRLGRRGGFLLSATVAFATALLGTWAIVDQNFWVFSGVSLLIGSNLAFIQQYRFAAAESVAPQQVSKAVSFVITGTLVAALVSPQVALATRWWFPEAEFAGSFAALAIMYLAAIGVLSQLRDVKTPVSTEPTAARGMGALLRQPEFIVAMLAGMVGFGIMSFIMTATPVSMHVVDKFSVEDTALVIQSHIISMYLPALFSGFLIARFGVPLIMGVGVIAMGACIALAGTSHDFMHYWGALVLLGIGWNFLFISGTTLLTRSYHPEERFQAQAINDFAVFGCQAATSLLAGVAIHYLGWTRMNLLNVPFLAVMLLGVALIAVRERRARPA